MRDNRRARDDSPPNETRRSRYSDIQRSRTDHSTRSPARRREEEVDIRAKRHYQGRVSDYGLERGRNFDRGLPRRTLSPPAPDRSEDKQSTWSHPNRPIDAEPVRSSKRRRTRSPSPLSSFHRSHQSPLRDRNRGHSRERWNQDPKFLDRSEGKSRRPNTSPRIRQDNPLTTTGKPHHHTHQSRQRSRSPHRPHSPNSQRWGRSPTPEFRHRRKRNRNRRRRRSSSRHSNHTNLSRQSVAPVSRQGSPTSQSRAEHRGQTHIRDEKVEKVDMDNNRGRQSYPGPGMN